LGRGPGWGENYQETTTRRNCAPV